MTDKNAAFANFYLDTRGYGVHSVEHRTALPFSTLRVILITRSILVNGRRNVWLSLMRHFAKNNALFCSFSLISFVRIKNNGNFGIG